MKRILVVVSILVTLGLSQYILGNNKDSGSKVNPEHLSDNPSSNEVTEEAFNTMMKVISHKRCVNCHPSGNRPNQGEDSHPHRFDVQRGEDGHGLAALECSTCHQEENNDMSGVPGAPHWHLAPRSMGWEGLNKFEIAEAMLDKSKNGGRSVQEIEKHLTEDALVLWVFEPGVNNEGIEREKPPVSKAEFISAVKTWVKSGANIPTQK